MHPPFTPPANIVARVTQRIGRPHPFDRLDPARTALIVVDMQNYFLAPGSNGEAAAARGIVPSINRLAAALRARGGHVAWLKQTMDGTQESWSHYHRELANPDFSARRIDGLRLGDPGHELHAGMEVRPEDAVIVKRRYSAFIQGSSELEPHLRARGIDSLLITGTITQICCESTARDAMMLNFRTVMISDGCASFTDAEHAASLTAFYSIFGDVQTVDEAIASMGGAARQAAE